MSVCIMKAWFLFVYTNSMYQAKRISNYFIFYFPLSQIIIIAYDKENKNLSILILI